MKIDTLNDEIALNFMNANLYKENSEFQYYHALNLVNVHSFKGNENILDIGCGDGKITYQLSKKVPNGKVIGIDPSSSMIKLASKLFPNDKIKNLEFKISSTEDYLEENMFDIIVGFNSIHWIKNQYQAFENIYKSLKPSGKLLTLIEPRDCPLWEICEELLIENYKELLLNSMYPFGWMEEDYKRALYGLGFKEIHTSIYTEPIFLKNRKDILNLLDPCTNCFLRAPEKIYQKFLLELTDKIEKACSLKENNGIVIPAKMIAFYYQK